MDTRPKISCPTCGLPMRLSRLPHRGICYVHRKGDRARHDRAVAYLAKVASGCHLTRSRNQRSAIFADTSDTSKHAFSV